MSDELFSDEKEQIPDEYNEIFDSLVGRGYSPSSVVASINYIESDKTQYEVAKNSKATAKTIRNVYPEVVALKPGLEMKETGGPTVLEMIKDIADCLDWENGRHYTVDNDGYHPEEARLNKPGLKDIYRRLLEGEIDDN